MTGPAKDQFQRCFGHPPTVAARAPGRVNLIGEHVDYLGGLVMPVAIDRQVAGLAAPNGTGRIRLWSETRGGVPLEIDAVPFHPRTGPGAWLNYPMGVLTLYREAGIIVPGFDAAFFSTLPPGAGLSSSAALETATALLIESLAGVRLDPVDRALLCQRAEHRFAGVPCGLMDQLAVGTSRAGHALLIDCRDLSRDPVPLPGDLSLVVADTGVKHALADGAYRQRREDCEEAARILGVATLRDATLAQVVDASPRLGDRLVRRARHAVTEIDRVRSFATLLRNGDLAGIGPVMRAGHDSLRDDFAVSCPELDCLVAAAESFGADRGLIGSRMTGGGFGGSTVSLVRADAADALARHLEIAFSARFGHAPAVFSTRSADGAGPLPL